MCKFFHSFHLKQFSFTVGTDSVVVIFSSLSPVVVIEIVDFSTYSFVLAVEVIVVRVKLV